MTLKHQCNDELFIGNDRQGAGCEALLVWAHGKKLRLERKRRDLGDAIGIFRSRMDDIDRETDVTRLSLDAFTAAFVAMPGVKEKMDMAIKAKRLEVRQLVLQRKALRYHANALLGLEIKYKVML